MNKTLKWLSNLIAESFSSLKGVRETIISESGKYLGLEFDDKVSARKVYS